MDIIIAGVIHLETDLEVSLGTVAVKKLSFFVNPENCCVGRHLIPFLPSKERKDKTKERHLTTPLRENQLHQCGTPVVTLVST